MWIIVTIIQSFSLTDGLMSYSCVVQPFQGALE